MSVKMRYKRSSTLDACTHTLFTFDMKMKYLAKTEIGK